MKIKLFILTSILAIIGFTSCNLTQTENADLAKLPVLTTTIVTAIADTAALTGGVITSEGGSSLKARGVCWSTSANPTIANHKTVNGAGIGTFTSAMKGLADSTAYFVRAYATNSNGTAYGGAYQFTTLKTDFIPVLSTSVVSTITATTATCGGTITDDGGTPVTSRGVCWSITPNPTIANSKTADGTGVGFFTSSLTGLSASTTYYVRSYATNIKGTAYGSSYQFSSAESQFNPSLTYGTMTDKDGNAYKTISIGTQTWMAENLKTTKYRTGESITNVTDNTTWANATTGTWCYYNNDATYNTKYGKLYNWYAVVDTRNIAPVGWHVATYVEWTTLINYLIANGYNYDGTTTGYKIAKALAATTDWTTYTGVGTIGNNLSLNNSSGFSAVPGGCRYYGDGTFYYLGSYGYWWTATDSSTSFAGYWGLSYGSSGVNGSTNSKLDGCSVRCVKDN